MSVDTLRGYQDAFTRDHAVAEYRAHRLAYHHALGIVYAAYEHDLAQAMRTRDAAVASLTADYQNAGDVTTWHA